MIAFRIELRPGISIYEQIVYAAKKAIVSGQLRPGDAFPSVRELGRELKINPNTAHKVISNLVAAGLLETKAGIGTVVSSLPKASASERTQLLGSEIEELVVEAKKLGIGFDDVVNSIAKHWKKIGPSGGGSENETEGRGRR